MKKTTQFIAEQIEKMEKADLLEIQDYYSPKFLEKMISTWQSIWLHKRPGTEFANFNEDYTKFLRLILDLSGHGLEISEHEGTEALESKIIHACLMANKDSKISSIKDLVNPIRKNVQTTVAEHANQYPDAKSFGEEILQALTYLPRLKFYSTAIGSLDTKVQQNLEFLVFFILRRKKYLQLSFIRGEEWDS